MMMGGTRLLIEAGGRVHEPGCLGCLGMGQAPASGPNPQIVFPERYFFKEEWFIQPPVDGAQVEILRGPNIKPFPRFNALADTLDAIMPAGNRVLPFRSNIPAISDFVFDRIDPEFTQHARTSGGGFIVGGQS